MPRTAILSLGSNLGDRIRNLRLAVREIGTFARVVRISRLFETEPLDSPAGASSYLNLVTVVITDLSPREMLRRTGEVESRLGRRRGIRNAPRTIDIDILMVDGISMRTEELTLPHPRFRERNFVLDPLREVAPAWIDARSGQPLAKMSGGGVTKRAGKLFGR
jgi:2-amino-4-hydroxy-6-hydroxymethyldihydropteridine diphosphokinase